MGQENNRVTYFNNTQDFSGSTAFLTECPHMVCAYYCGDTSEARRDLEDPINISSFIGVRR